jgi:hypothetical protein
MANEDQNVRMPMGDRGHAAERGSNEEDDEMRGAENDDMDDLREDESDEEENYDNDDGGDEDEDESDDDDEEEEEVDNEIVDKFTRTFHNGDYDAEFDDALSYDRSVTIPNQATQAAYNKPDNWRERNRIGLEKVKRQLQTCIDSVTRGNSFDLILTHNIYEDQEEPIVWHEPILDRYWDVLEAEIDSRKQQEIVTDIRGIHIENVEMKKERIAALVDICRSGRATNSSTQVIFNNANICGEGIVCLSKLVDISSNLQMLFIRNNQIDDMESACCLSRALKSHNHINNLDLSHCDLGSTPEMISVILQSDVSNIRLSSNNIDSLGAVKIAEYLEGDPPIQRIGLDHNQLNDDDAILISQALKRNTNLMLIILHSNNLSCIGVKALLTCVFDGSSLNAILESNHTLKRMIFFDGNNLFFHQLKGCIEGLLELDQCEKIMLALQDKESLLRYLVDIPVTLMPEVLAFPLERFVDEHQRKHLNIVYSTMRWWNMPLLYSYNICVKSDTKRKKEMTV